MGLDHHGKTWNAGFTKLKNLEHAVLHSVRRMAAIAHLRNHMGPTWRSRPPLGLGHTSDEGDMRSYHGTSEV